MSDLPTAYLDTSVVSGLAKGDLNEADAKALLHLLKAGKQGDINLVTSTVTKDEIANVPEMHRSSHEMIYNLLADVPAARQYHTDSGLMLVGVGGGQREDPLLASLKSILPDENDALHLFQAAKNEVTFFLTADRRTIIRHREAIEAACSIKAVDPVELWQLVAAGGGA